MDDWDEVVDPDIIMKVIRKKDELAAYGREQFKYLWELGKKQKKDLNIGAQKIYLMRPDYLN